MISVPTTDQYVENYDDDSDDPEFLPATNTAADVQRLWNADQARAHGVW